MIRFLNPTFYHGDNHCMVKLHKIPLFKVRFLLYENKHGSRENTVMSYELGNVASTAGRWIHHHLLYRYAQIVSKSKIRRQNVVLMFSILFSADNLTGGMFWINFLFFVCLWYAVLSCHKSQETTHTYSHNNSQIKMYEMFD